MSLEYMVTKAPAPPRGGYEIPAWESLISKEEYDKIIRKGTYTEWFVNPIRGQPRMIDIYRVRQYARSEWVSTVINHVINKIKIIDYEIIPRDVEKRDQPSERILQEIKRAKDLFDECTPDGKSFKDAVESALIKDILELDAGVLCKAYTKESYDGDPFRPRSLKPRGYRTLGMFYALDGGAFLKDIGENMVINGYWQYHYRRPFNSPVYYDPEEIVYIMRYPRSFSPYGWSPIQASDAILNSLINSVTWNANFFNNQAIPKGMITIAGTDADLQRFRLWWKNRIEGKWHNIPIVNSETKFVPFSMNAADMEWLSGQKWYQRMVCALYQVHPSEIGVEDTSRTAGAALSERDRLQKTTSVLPILKLVENAVNRELLPEISPRIAFKYSPADPDADKAEADMQNAFIENGLTTINEIRAARGKIPVPWGDLPPSILNNLIRSWSRMGVIPPIEQMNSLDFKNVKVPEPRPAPSGREEKEDAQEREE